MTTILITGSLGQIGSELIDELRKIYGSERIIGSDIQKPPKDLEDKGPFIFLDVLKLEQFKQAIIDYDVDWIIHNAAILSATGERKPQLALKVNARGFENAMEIAKEFDLRILAPSSIAAFGPSTPSVNTPDVTIMKPNTMYGITKVWTELLGQYYHTKWNVDFRSLRYPGIISYKALPGGGTTDYAVEIYYSALKKASYKSFLREDTLLPMMYMPDCIKGTIEFLKTDKELLKQQVYNLSSMSFSPMEIAAEIKKHIPNFTITYEPDYRQEIADGWPNSIDDSNARKQWGWKPKYDLEAMTEEMLEKLSQKLDIQYTSAINK